MKPSIIVATCLVFVGSTGFAQDGMPEMPKPTKQHEWLKKFVGTWEMTSQGTPAEGMPPVEAVGTVKSEMLGGFWVVNKMDAKVSGMGFKGLQTVGYDVKKKKYVGTWIDTMNGYMWKYEGNVDKTGKKIVLEADGPGMLDPNKTTKYRDAYEFKSSGEYVLTSEMQGPDGKWVTFNRGTAKRKKATPKKRG